MVYYYFEMHYVWFHDMTLRLWFLAMLKNEIFGSFQVGIRARARVDVFDEDVEPYNRG